MYEATQINETAHRLAGRFRAELRFVGIALSDGGWLW